MKNLTLILVAFTVAACSTAENQDTDLLSDTADTVTTEIHKEVLSDPDADVEIKAASEVTAEVSPDIQQSTAYELSCEADANEPGMPQLYLSCPITVSKEDTFFVKLHLADAPKLLGVSFHVGFDPIKLKLVKAESIMEGYNKGKFWKFVHRVEPGKVVGAIAVFDGNKSLMDESVETVEITAAEEMVKLIFRILEPGETKLSVDFHDTAIMGPGPSFPPVSRAGVTVTVKEVGNE